MANVPSSLLKVWKMMEVDLAKEYGIPPANAEMSGALQEYLGRGGKYLRPALTFVTTEAYQLDMLEKALLPIMRVQNYDHNFFLIHDDVEDGSMLRRGKPTLHVSFGIPKAINYGDYLRSLADKELLKYRDVDPALYGTLSSARTEMMETTSRGQDLEFVMRENPLAEATEQGVLEILRNKTAHYTAFTPIRYGTIFAGKEYDALSIKENLMGIGVAFQVIDDTLDLLAEKEEENAPANLVSQKFGKDWLGDLEEVKRTYPLVKLIEAVSPSEREIVFDRLDIYGKMPRLVVKKNDTLMSKIGTNMRELAGIEKQIDEIKLEILGLVKDYKITEQSWEFAKDLYDSNIGAIDERLPDTEGRKKVDELLYYAIGRLF